MAQNTLLFPSVLLLSDTLSPNAVDKKVIREAGCTQITSMSSGEEAARFLAQDPLAAAQRITVVNERLSDMSGEQFASLVRLHPRLVAIPLLLVVTSENERDQLLALGCGASSLLARPFSVEDMQSELLTLAELCLKAQKLAQVQNKLDTCEFEECLNNLQTLLKPSRHKPEEFFQVGMQCLAQKKWNSAISAFHRALASQLIKGEAALGMACAYKGKGREREMTLWLQKACDAFVAAGKWQLARMVFARLAALGETRNPFFVQARKQILDGEYEAAVTTLMESLETVAAGVAGEKMAELCILASSPSLMLTYLHEAIEERLGNTSLAACLLRNFSIKQQEQSLREEKASEQRAQKLSRRLAHSGDTARTENCEPDLDSQDEPKAKSGNRIGIPLREEDLDPGLLLLPDGEGKIHGKGELPPFTSPQFTFFPGFNDLLSMIKMTWQLVRKQDQSP
ncbi:MAG: hypothetical protein K6G15_00205 [Desulfovibrio sp.]|nr:hypothetical protein [Desulfovibrio sp.]